MTPDHYLTPLFRRCKITRRHLDTNGRQVADIVYLDDRGRITHRDDGCTLAMSLLKPLPKDKGAA